MAHQLLDGLVGIEVGGSSHNSFGIAGCVNVDFTDDMHTIFKEEERKIAGFALPVDVIAHGDALPFADASLDFVLSSHVLEHFWDPISAIKEWLRVTRAGGYVYMIVPHKERTFDKERPRTPLRELLERHDGTVPKPVYDTVEESHQHWSVWITEDVVELCRHMMLEIVAVQDVDNKVGNGFTVVVKKPGQLTASTTNGAGLRSIGPIDLGCGTNKRAGYIGVDRVQVPGVDAILDFSQPLPLPDNSVVGIYSNHALHEVGDPLAVLRELLRVCKHGTDVELWLPHGRCDAATGPNARSRFTDFAWERLLAAAAGPGAAFVWEQAWYVIPESTQQALRAQNISLDFGANHLCNVIQDFGVMLRVDKKGQPRPVAVPKRSAIAQRP